MSRSRSSRLQIGNDVGEARSTRRRNASLMLQLQSFRVSSQ